MDEIGKDEILKLKRKVLKAKLLGLPESLSEEEKEAIKKWKIKEDEKKCKELEARLLEKKSLAPIPDDGVWLEDIIRKEEKERGEYIEKNHELIEQKVLNRTPTPFTRKISLLGYYPLNVSLDIIIYTHDKLLENSSNSSVYSTFKVDGALLYLVTDDLFYHITLLFYNVDKANIFYQDRWLSKFECHPRNYAPITTVDFDKKDDKNGVSYYLSRILEGIFHISPFEHIETTFKIANIK